MNCKPGMLAYIVRALLPENVGNIVEVVNDGVYQSDCGWMWLTRSERPTRFVWSDGSYDPRDVTHETYVPDADLRPITPPDSDVTDEEVRKLYSGRELVNIVKERL